jgi:methionyl aminopeptidase
MIKLIHPDQIAAGLAIRRMFSDMIGHNLAGMSTLEVQDMVVDRLRQSGAEPACQGYKGFPEHICISLDDEAAHGIPSAKKIVQEDSVLKIDVVAKVGEYHADSCVTLYAGSDPSIRNDVIASYLVLKEAISRVAPGVKISTISRLIDKVSRRLGLRTIRTFYGHGIGTRIHQEPWVPNFLDTTVKDHTLEVGDVITIEPTLTRGSGLVSFDEDGWTARSKGGEMCYMFEHTVAVTETGRRVLT